MKYVLKSTLFQMETLPAIHNLYRFPSLEPRKLVAICAMQIYKASSACCPPVRSSHEMLSKHDPCLQLSHPWLLPLPTCALISSFGLASQRRLGADRWASTRKLVSHECGDFAAASFSSIDAVEALKAPPALDSNSLIVER